MLQEDLECLTGKLISGSITPVVYDLLKDSPYKDDLRELLSPERSKKDALKHKTRTVAQPKSNGRTSIEEWLSQHGQPVSL